ncbi:MAG: hypothetical protein MH252_22515 [Thermosynechococcaceae cyanobacterium MS004]|nr:hypothetical protein [Thermosynechococcaceae cyanobacterium MS004]
METLQQQLTVINEKLEAMHQKIEVLSTQIPELLAAARTSPSVKPLTSPAPTLPTITHRDVLEDEDPMVTNAFTGKSMSHELQMQRLMAQLTAAYNRIAALEEQLLSQRIH